ncbi:MAG: 4Fe-4S ferredoxin, iron-sulfur binding, partial [uncultured Frankineae bacterium]
DVRDRRALRGREGQGLHRGVPCRLHLRGQALVVHPPGRVRGLRSLRARVPGGGDLLRGRHPGAVEGLLPRERRLLHRDHDHRLAGRREQGRPGRPRPPRGHGRPARQEHRGPL